MAAATETTRVAGEPRPEKVAVVTEVRERLSASNGALLTEYRGLKVSDLARLRHALREAGGEYGIYKNTLVRRAAVDLGLDDLVDLLVGPTAIAFVSGDPVAVAKSLRDFAKTSPNLVVKGGLLGKKVLSASEASALADVAPREVVLAQLAGALAAPLVKMAGLLQALPRNFAYGLKALLDLKAADAPAEPVAAEAPAELAATDAPADQPATPVAAEAPADEPSTPATAEAPPELAADTAGDAPATPETAEAPADEPATPVAADAIADSDEPAAAEAPIEPDQPAIAEAPAAAEAPVEPDETPSVVTAEAPAEPDEPATAEVSTDASAETPDTTEAPAPEAKAESTTGTDTTAPEETDTEETQES